MVLRDSEGWGATRIHRELERRYGEGVVSQRAISKWIASIGPRTDREEPAPWRRWEPELWQQDAGYLLKLDLVSRGLLGRGLYDEEARWASRLELALQGRSIFAQWAVVEEYARRHLNSEAPTTDDLDLMLATRPWSDEGMLESAARRAGIGTFPMIRSLLLPYSVSRILFEPSSDERPELLMVLTPRTAARLLSRLDRTFVELRIRLHISHQLQQPIFIQPRSRHEELRMLRERTSTTISKSDDEDPNEIRVEQTLDEAELLLVDLFKSIEVDRRQTDGK